MTASTKPERRQPDELCANPGCRTAGVRWHCPPTNHQCDWIVCTSCNRQYQRSRPSRWRPWKTAEK